MKIQELSCPNCKAPLPTEVLPNQQVSCGSCGAMLVLTGLDEVETSPAICPNCRTVNPASQRHCASCGEALQDDCILCHTPNRIGTIFCINCGAHLNNARSRRLELQRRRAQHRAERDRLLKEKEVRQAEEKLQQLLDDLDEPENHDFALYRINQLGSRAVEPLITTLLTDSDPDARYGSARALGQICSEHEIKGLIKARAIKALIEALADPEPAVRYWSIDSLARCKAQLAVEPLALLTKDQHAGVRQHALYALQQIGGERAQELLDQAAKPKGILKWIKGK